MSIMEELPPMREKRSLTIKAQYGGRITKEGMALVHRLLQSRLGERMEIISSVGLGNALGWNWNKGMNLVIQFKPVKLSGTFPRRVSKWVKARFDIDLPKEDLEKIGALAKKHLLPGKTYYYDLTDKFDWKSGRFGDEGSCFWGSKASAKDIISDHKGMALRFFNEHGEGYARCWVIPRGDALLTMNGYGLDLLEQSQILAEIVSAKAVRVLLTNRQRTDGLVWINNGRGYIISDAPPVRDTIIDLDFDTTRECLRCHNRYEGGSYWVDEIEVCRDCLNYAHRCNRCDKWSFRNPVEKMGRTLGNVCTECAKEAVMCDKDLHAWWKEQGIAPNECPYCKKGKGCACCGNTTCKCPACKGVICKDCHETRRARVATHPDGGFVLITNEMNGHNGYYLVTDHGGDEWATQRIPRNIGIGMNLEVLPPGHNLPFDVPLGLPQEQVLVQPGNLYGEWIINRPAVGGDMVQPQAPIIDNNWVVIDGGRPFRVVLNDPDEEE